MKLFIHIVSLLQFRLALGFGEWQNATFNVEGPGKDHVIFRVVNGQPATYGDVPWQVGFMKRSGRLYRVYCGGSIVQPRLIVSAAHCFEGADKGSVSSCLKGSLSTRMLRDTVAVGGFMKSFNSRPFPDSPDGQWRYLERARYPSSYHFPKDDVAIVLTKRPFNFNQYIHPIPLASERKDYQGTTCLASGYGRISNTETSERLLFANIEVISIQQCNDIHKKDMSKFVCTSDLFSDVHKGDSGGPLVCKGVDHSDKGEGVLVGIVSGKNMQLKSGSFFTRVTTYRKFITDPTIFREGKSNRGRRGRRKLRLHGFEEPEAWASSNKVLAFPKHCILITFTIINYHLPQL